jgi:hypothetical protein
MNTLRESLSFDWPPRPGDMLLWRDTETITLIISVEHMGDSAGGILVSELETLTGGRLTIDRWTWNRERVLWYRCTLIARAGSK